MSDSYHDQLLQDTPYLRGDRRLDTELLDRLVLQLNRIYPQILTDKEAQKFRNLKVPTGIRLAELLTHLQKKGEEACHEFYRALQIHAEDIYVSLPSRMSKRGPLFFISCFSVAVGAAFLYYYGAESKVLGDAKKILGFTALGLGRRAKEVLVSYAKDNSSRQ
ncbi:caspase recruitment domain-containing protein 19 isoform X2 [Lepisosteus oculatus]|uniref:caspase recruitment domain-containing protein 19 isoform X2 n=1 Tax=Lepisosteus oculatus TaxID=7918 RepID=UPI0007400ACF|nr:PREDICTED: bcl10-interacting CARD protein isoform X2 [Lepisosteus oculatus]